MSQKDYEKKENTYRRQAGKLSLSKKGKNNFKINSRSLCSKYKRKNRHFNDYYYNEYNSMQSSYNYNNSPYLEEQNQNNNKKSASNKKVNEFITIKASSNEDSEKPQILETVPEEKNQSQKKNENPQKYVYSYEYLIQFEKMASAMETNFLNTETLIHIGELEKDLKPLKKNNSKSISENSSCHTSRNNSSSNINVSLETWAKKDYSKEIKAAEDNKKKFDENKNIDPTKKQLRELLNILTKDNYEDIKKNIIEIIKSNVDEQAKFIEVFFTKACMETSYVEIYVKLCKDLNKELPQKSKSKEDGKDSKKTSSEFRVKLIHKCKLIFQGKNYNEFIKVRDPDEYQVKLEKFILGNIIFITGLIKVKLLSKRAGFQCISHLFQEYKSENDKVLKKIHILAIIKLVENLGAFIHSEEKNIKKEELKGYKKNIEEIFKQLEEIKDNETGQIHYKILNLIDKKKNNFEKTKYEKSLLAKSKKEVEEEFNNKEKGKEGNDIEEEINQDTINKKIKKDLYDYKDFVESEGSSNNFKWETTTHLYDLNHKNYFEEILEGYILSCSDFIEKESYIKYAKDYIKEFVEYYNNEINKEKKKQLKNKIFDLFENVKDYAFETPKIYEIYAYVLYLLIDNKIMDIEDLENIKELEAIEEDLKEINIVYKNIYKDIKNDEFKNIIKKFGFIDKNKKIFEWVF